MNTSAADLPRCSWCDSSELYRRYHDEEWGRPVADGQQLFELLCLELFQSGLSWLTILKRREGFRRAFAHFDTAVLAGFTEADEARLLQDEGIIRHRGKIHAVIHNARQAQALKAAGGSLPALLWQHAPAPTALPVAEVRAQTPASQALAKTLKQQGWVWLGPTTLHAFMQAAGMVNEHHARCHAWAASQADRMRFQPPV